jgi:DNA-directed RNA polymerase specialized sigma24 family protein
VTRLTDVELEAALAAQDWKLLWDQGLTLVRPAIAVLNRSGLGFTYEQDTLQQASLIVGEVVRRWRPIEGAFSKWVLNGLCWRLRMWQRRELRERGLYVDQDGEEETQPGQRTLDTAVYEDAPLGFSDPLDEAIRLEEQAAVLRALAQLPASERAAVISVYGLDGLGGMTIDDYALAAGVARRTAFYTLDQARRRLILKLRAA